MASPAGTPNTSSLLFRPPNPGPTNPAAAPAQPLPFHLATSYSAPPASGPFSYPPATPFHHHYLHYPQDPLRPTIPFPPGIAAASPAPAHPSPHVVNPNPNPNPSSNQNPGARLMALLNPSTTLETAVSMSLPSSMPSEFSAPPNATEMLHLIPSAPPVAMTQPAAPARLPSTKLPRGRFLGGGERAIYDVDSRLLGETQPPQLEVAPITKYTSDPGLVLGRQIAVNRTYICYGLKLGAIRVLNIITALRSLLKGHSQRVTDMGFFAEDVPLLASASVDGRVFVWKIDEGPDEENKPQITGKIVIAIQIVGDAESYHPRICWHSHKQEILFVGIGNCVLRIDTNKLARGKEFSAEEPLRCPLQKLIDGVQLIGKHDADVTDLSISQWMITRLATASKDGMVKIWDDRKAMPLATFRPHDGHPVNSVVFMTSPHRPDHINLITAGPLNREVKIWASASEEGWLFPSDSESWQCTQTLDLRSSLVTQLDEAFFNQIVVLAQASLIVIANAKKNEIYAVHVDFGPYPNSTRMDCIADFTVTMPILSLTGTYESPSDGGQVVQVYCVQTQAIQQYALDLAQCLPPPTANTGSGKDLLSRIFELPGSEGSSLPEPSHGPTIGDISGSASSKAHHTESIAQSALVTTRPVASTTDMTNMHELSTANVEVKPSAPPFPSADTNALHVASPSPLNLDLAGRLPGLRSPHKASEVGQSSGDRDSDRSHFDYSTDRRIDPVVTSAPDIPYTSESIGKDEPRAGQPDVSMLPNPHHMFKLSGNTTHLITPSEILLGAISSSESSQVNQGLMDEEVKIPDKIFTNTSLENVEVEVKVVGEGRLGQQDEFVCQKVPRGFSIESNVEKSNQSSDSNLVTENDFSLVETSNAEGTRQGDDISFAEAREKPPSAVEEKVQYIEKDIPEKVAESSTTAVPQSVAAAKGTKQKANQFQTSGPSPSSSPFNSMESLNEPGSSTTAPSVDAAGPQILAMHDMLTQLMSMQQEMQKQMSVMVAAPVIKEGKRLETVLGRNMEKAIRTNVDVLWARVQEENAKREKVEKESMQQISLIANLLNKDLPALFERSLKKEISSVGPAVARAITPIISSAIAESFQRGVGDKAVNQLEKSVMTKIEATVARQIQTQFQTSAKQAIQDTLRFCLESSVVPAFEQSCKAMFEQVDSAFQKGMTEHMAAAQQHFDAAHNPLSLALRDAMNSASSITQNLTSELIDGQRKLLALVAVGNANTLAPAAVQQANGPMGGLLERALSIQQVEAPLDPTKELSRLISERKYEEAFTMALQRSDVPLVSWLCSQVDLHAICSTVPVSLSQGVLLALLQQLACDINNDTTRKVGWMTDVAVSIDPTDHMITLHVRPIFEQVYNILGRQRSLPTTTPSEASNIRLIMHVINSVLMSCK